MSWAEIKKALNTSLGTEHEVALNERPLSIESGRLETDKIFKPFYNYRDSQYALFNHGDGVMTMGRRYSSSEYEFFLIKNSGEYISLIRTPIDSTTDDMQRSDRSYYDVKNNKLYWFHQSLGTVKGIYFLQDNKILKYNLSVDWCMVELPYIYYTFVGMTGVLYKFDTRTSEKIKVLDLPTNPNFTWNTKKEHMWYIATDKGVYRFDTSNESLTKLSDVVAESGTPNPTGKATFLKGYYSFDNETEEITKITTSLPDFKQTRAFSDKYWYEIKKYDTTLEVYRQVIAQSTMLGNDFIYLQKGTLLKSPIDRLRYVDEERLIVEDVEKIGDTFTISKSGIHAFQKSSEPHYQTII